LQVHGAGAGPRGPQNLPQQAANRPQGSQPGGQSSPVTPLEGSAPPAHGVRRLLEAGHFAQGSSAYTAHAAKFGVPAYALAAETPIDELPTDETSVGEVPVVEVPLESPVVEVPLESPVVEAPIIEQIVIEAPTLDELIAPLPTEPTAPKLLDIDTLLMEQLIAEQEEPPTLLETLAAPLGTEPPTLLAEIVETIEQDTAS